jgi:hypothetical protein
MVLHAQPVTPSEIARYMNAREFFKRGRNRGMDSKVTGKSGAYR